MQRVVLSIFILWFVLTITFFILRILPGDAISAQLAIAGATSSEIEERRQDLGLNSSLPSQYIDYLVRLIHGDMGQSLVTGLPVSQMIVQQLPKTAELATGALFISCILGLSLGMLATLSNQRLLVSLCNLLITVAIATPIYWTGTLLIALVVVELKVLPLIGSEFAGLILPIGLLGFHISGAIARMTKINIGEIIHSDYIRTAHSKGLPSRLIFRRHVLRNALIPIISIIALQTGFLFSGTVITETLFSRAGLGNLLLTATRNQDYPLVQGLVIFSAFIYICANLIGEALQKLIDPRV